MMCLNCLVGLHNLCLGKCKCICHHQTEMEKTYSDIKAVLAHRKRKVSMQGYKELPRPTDEAVLVTLRHVEWLRNNSGKFPNRPKQEEVLVRSGVMRALPCTKPCRWCKKTMQFGTKHRDHGIGKCIPVCEECGWFRATIKTSDGYQLCEKCNRECNTLHIKGELPKNAPIHPSNLIIYPRPIYQKPTITRMDVERRRTSDYGSLYGGGY
jgi:hypothetical protein